MTENWTMQVSVKFMNGDVLLNARGTTQEGLDNAVADMLFVAEKHGIIGASAVTSVGQSNGHSESPEMEQIDVESIEFVGKNRWIVKGGWAKQYGITVWPEVLEEAGLLEHLKLDEVNEPHKKWVATYTKKPKNNGDGMTADKVVKLTLAE